MTDGYRKAALKLHAMSPADQRWMLQQLGEEEQARLTALLQELKDLGISSTEDVTAEISADEVRNKLLEAAPDRAETEKAFQAIQSASAIAMNTVLSGESDLVIAAILGMYPWRWRSAFLADAGVEMRLRLGRVLGHSTLLPRVACELVLLVGNRLSELAIHHEGDSPPFMEEKQTSERKIGIRLKKNNPFWERCRQWLR